ncbi:MAG: hypothetical protein COY42_05930 [Armatimonadetes bacterium CG_4_10_14_0_8_um_filter_66_14]|nr:MAG: hypothetical protein COY42_05930 [Armatimonadetes bacterium CG_4_10_14_0_8_um_filter_66_14]PJB71487.1 MAG: hypothetical protein CO096_09705 [Armatimonadetes bacterium CG_4_9_14_3_um_filter_66_14]
MRKMKITIHKDGSQRVEVLGAVGKECLQFTKELEARLGVAGERVLKPEYHECVRETEVERQHEVG